MPFLSRVHRSVAVGGATLALVAAGLLVPQAASARPSYGYPSYITCTTAALTTLVAEGSVVKKRGVSGTGFYTKGGGDFLGKDRTASASVAQTSPGYYRWIPLCA